MRSIYNLGSSNGQRDRSLSFQFTWYAFPNPTPFHPHPISFLYEFKMLYFYQKYNLMHLIVLNLLLSFFYLLWPFCELLKMKAVFNRIHEHSQCGNLISCMNICSNLLYIYTICNKTFIIHIVFISSHFNCIKLDL